MKKKLLKFKKRSLVVFLSMIAIFAVGCSSSTEKQENTNTQQEKGTINLGVTQGAPTLPILQMVETNAMGDNVDLNLEY